jgi:ATP-binding cassette subfamily G (WHITE) protein 2 (PDR)
VEELWYVPPYFAPSSATNTATGILWAYCIFNIVAALALYWLVRMPKKPKTEKAHKKSAPVANDQSPAASEHEKEADMHTRRYASITGNVTPPARDVAGEKV